MTEQETSPALGSEGDTLGILADEQIGFLRLINSEAVQLAIRWGDGDARQRSEGRGGSHHHAQRLGDC